MFDALRFVPMIGYYVRAERPATDAEAEEYGTDQMGGEGVVIAVHDLDRSGWVRIELDANTPIVVAEGECWTWHVWRRAPHA
jgi:hypothetical protein